MPDPRATVSIVSASDLERGEVLDLYEAVGWAAYTRQPDVLMRALCGSHRLAAARQGGTLVGLARTLSDSDTIVYVQDILVTPHSHRTGIGRNLVTVLLESYADIRQQVLLTDTDPAQRAFYESLGFVETHDHTPALRAFVRFAAEAPKQE